MIAAPSVSFTRPADTTAYASGDLVANSTTAGSVVPLKFSCAPLGSGRGRVRRARIHKSATSATNANFNLHLFSAAPTVTNGDNGALAVAVGTTYLGKIALDMTTTGFSATDGLFQSAAPGAAIHFDLGTERALYGLLEAAAGYTPANGEVITVTLELSDA